jgi:ABC-type amino acid transport substrate-binding protein
LAGELVEVSGDRLVRDERCIQHNAHRMPARPLSGQADAVFDDFSTLSLAAADNPNLTVLAPLTREPSGIILRMGDQVWTNWVNYFLDDYFSSGVSTCGCGKEMLRKWFKTEPLPLKFAY